MLTVFLWGANNAATKYLVRFWPPGWIGCTRLLFAGIFLLLLLYLTPWFGRPAYPGKALSRQLWWKCGVSLAIYIVSFNFALSFTSASHVALYLGMSPIWTLVWDHPPSRSWRSAQRYGAAVLALIGVIILFWPSLGKGKSDWMGEMFGIVASVLWANYGIQCRGISSQLSGAEISAHSMWRAGLLLSPMAAYELGRSGLTCRADLFLVQSYCIFLGGGIAYVMWNNALKQWPTSQVYLFNNLIPLTTMACSFVFLSEPVTKTFWIAMSFVVGGVVLGQARWEKLLGTRWFPGE